MTGHQNEQSQRPAGLVSGLAAIAALMAAVVGLQYARETRYPDRQIQDDALYLTSGTMLKRLAVAYQPLLADVYWIRAVQYYGGTRKQLDPNASGGSPPPATPPGVHRYAMLYPLLDITTTLDPKFNIAYRFGSIFLAEPPPGGPGEPEHAIELLQKGLQANPDKWQYMQDIGFVYYWWRHDYATAASWFDRGAQVPGAPWWLKSLAASTLAAGGDRRSSRLMWEAIRESAEIDWLRNDADRQLAQLQALDEIDALNAAIDRYRERTGTAPSGWADLVKEGMLRGMPIDPSGTAYALESGRAALTRTSRLWPLPSEFESGGHRP